MNKIYAIKFEMQLGASSLKEARESVAKYLGVPVSTIKKHFYQD